MKRRSRLYLVIDALFSSAIISALTALDRAICRIKGHNWDDKAAPYRHCFRCHKYEARGWLEPRRKDKGK